MKSPIAVSLFHQILIILPVSTTLFFWDKDAAYSFALGAAVFVVPNLYFTIYAFRYRGAELSRWISRSFSWGESGKLALTAVGFALVFRFYETVQVPTMFVGFISMIVLQWWVARKIAKLMSIEAQ